ncbi:rhodanese-like domain-containing protein [Psychrobacillus sp. NEAU-3TGS]|uniref:rhodanese-like domain-containing protein n=1 Tax=Psychrobacillus sp. NEAU-3TGS TaxID=2995412 RepID=UPI0024986A44|nr:rhodanese-like domain-containing protein [Psychrobacillus sp. NEAU-3TGS]MDI2589429.1 rhodanese-like domain-containing protein [Psychrobacillus sp. NEAU-3TGS]
MEYVIYILIALFLVFILQRALPTKGVRQLSTTDLKEELNNREKQFVDVRTPGEFKGNHIKGFKNIPLHQLSQKADKELLKEKEVIVICQSGMRSQKATKILKKMGFTKVTNVKGGISTWR